MLQALIGPIAVVLAAASGYLLLKYFDYKDAKEDEDVAVAQ